MGGLSCPGLPRRSVSTWSIAEDEPLLPGSTSTTRTGDSGAQGQTLAITKVHHQAELKQICWVDM